jgi:hypothetical protein
MNGQKEYGNPSQALRNTNRWTRVALWWLRHYEGITQFWSRFSWVWVIGVLFYVMVGYLDIAVALPFIFIVGIAANSGIYFSIRAIGFHLKNLQDGPEKEEAHELMIKIIKRRVLHGA